VMAARSKRRRDLQSGAATSLDVAGYIFISSDRTQRILGFQTMA
jgi:hypothetical protein